MNDKRVLIFGATGNVGGATAREMLRRGWQVRAVTRNPQSEKARALAALGAEVVQGDMDDRASLGRVVEGFPRVLSVQNWQVSGPEGEVRQGRQVAEAAHSAGVEHLVFASAGTGEADTGVPHFDNKLVIEAYMRDLGLPFTVVRPAPFMELMTAKMFFPPVGIWGFSPKVLGWDTPLPWVAVRDIGIANANIFENPADWIGREIILCGDVKTLSECREIYKAVNGKKPFRIPLPLWLFRKMAGDELIVMWRWMKAWIAEQGPQGLEKIREASRAVCPDPLDVASWLEMEQNGGKGNVKTGGNYE
ncbi:MAG TPA: NmrA/HSCARG family protein [Anaerolineae bacterium]|nr:NmrA/HSCARG family protein [Anaerolineae bacterium]